GHSHRIPLRADAEREGAVLDVAGGVDASLGEHGGAHREPRVRRVGEFAGAGRGSQQPLEVGRLRHQASAFLAGTAAAARGTKAQRSCAKVPSTRFATSTTSSWLSGPWEIPAAAFVMHEIPLQGMPWWAA